MLRRILFSLVFLVALALGLEIALTYLSQRGMEKALCSQYGIPGDLEVRINSFPFIMSLVRNHLGEIQLNWRGEMHGSFRERDVHFSYLCSVNLYDVELRMPSVLRGRLEIESLSRIRARLIVGLEDLKEIFGGDVRLPSAGDTIEVHKNGDIFKYKVQVWGSKTLRFHPDDTSTSRASTPYNYEAGVKDCGIELILSEFPIDFSLRKASATDERLVLEISIKCWEGYLNSSINDL